LTSQTTRAFRKRLEALPASIQAKAVEAFRTFESDPSHQSLSLKRVHSSRPVFSARIGRSYRALALLEEKGWIWFWIGHHSEYDNLIRRL
jgi:mRNA-degrading endonuclease RelE of RelBE toxin-antitoxin system